MDNELRVRVEGINNGVSSMLSKSLRDTLPKFDTTIQASFQYESAGRWFSIDCTMREYEAMLVTGHLDDKPLAAIEVSTTNVGNEAGDKIRMIYDFVKLHTNQCPWRML